MRHGAGAVRRVVPLDGAPESAADAVPALSTRLDVPILIGDGSIDYTCTGCGAVVCEGIAAGDLAGLVVRCACGAVGRVPRHTS